MVSEMQDGKRYRQAHDTLCRKTADSGGKDDLIGWIVMLTRFQLMGMNILPKLCLEDTV